MEVEAVDGDAGVGNEVFYEIISGKLNHIIIHSKYIPDSDWLKAQV